MAASLAFLSGCVTAPEAATSAEINQKGATFLGSESAQQRQQEIKQATKLTQQTSDSSGVAGAKPRVFWLGVALEGDSKRWENTLSEGLRETLRTEIATKLAGIKPAAIELLDPLQGSSNRQPTDGLIALVALSSESRFWYPDPVVKGSNRVVVRITGQLLFIDTLVGRVSGGSLNRVGWQVVGSYPVAIDMLGLSDPIPDPNDEVWNRVTQDALFGSQRAKDGKALSIRDQVGDQLNSKALAPRGMTGRGPVAVAPALVNAGDLGPDVTAPSRETQTAWADDLGFSLSRFLSAGSGLYVRPYVPGGGDEIRLNGLLKDAVNTFVEGRGGVWMPVLK